MLAGPLLRDVGFLHESLHFGAPSRFTLELSGLDVYPALLHWRRSEQFVHVDTVKFKLSRDGLVRDLQLSCLAKFFASLPLGMRLFRVVHFFLADYECGINVAALKDVILGVHRTGCLDLWIYSSYLAEVGTSDVVHLDEVEYTHEMERVTFQSPSVFSMALFPWFVRTLEAGTSLTSVDVVSVGLDPSRWSDILPSITLPRLQCLRLVGVDLVTLADFLHRHPSLQSIRLDGLYMDGPVPPSRRLMLPNLNTIEGNDSQIASFLAIVNPLRSLCFMTVVFREDCSMEIPSSFATEPCLTAFRHLARLQKAGYLSLSFNFSSLCKVSQPSFFLDQGESRPERLISVDRLEINVFGQSTAESIELLVRRHSYIVIYMLKFSKGWLHPMGSHVQKNQVLTDLGLEWRAPRRSAKSIFRIIPARFARDEGSFLLGNLQYRHYLSVFVLAVNNSF